MTIRYTCAECGVSMKIKDSLAGKAGKCPKCNATFVVPSPDAPEPADEDHLLGEEPLDEGWDDEEEEDDDLLDMPMEVTAAPAEPVAEMPPPAARDRKEASETKKATRISPKKKSGRNSGDFDPTDVLFEDDAPADRPPSGVAASRAVLDEGAPAASNMAAMFKDFSPAGGRKRETPAAKSTNVAADLLAKNQEERQKKNQGNPYETTPTDDDEGSELLEQIKGFGRQYGLYVGIGLVLIVGLYFGMNSMLGEDHPMPDLTPVYGTVTRSAGVSMLQITFTPAVEGRVDADAIDQSDGTAYTDSEGYYEIMYARDYPGLPPGRYKVSIIDNGRQVFSDYTEIKDGQDALNFSL